MICPLQGVGETARSVRSVLIQAGLWNVARLADESGLQPQEVMDVLYNQTATDHATFQLMRVVTKQKELASGS